MKRILFLTQKRKDAIGIVDYNVKKELEKLQHNFDFLEIKEKGETNIEIFQNYIINILKILRKTFFYKKVYFSRENPYIIFLKILFPWIKIVMCVHHIEDYRGKSLIGWLMIKCTNYFFAISNFTKNQLIEIGGKEQNIIVNYNGISNLFYPEIINNFKDYKYILYVGSEVKRKNLNQLLLAFVQVLKKYPNLKLIKIGKPVENINTMNNLINNLGIQNSIILKRDFIKDEELRKYYSNAICYVSISKLEGFGLTIPEAMSCGCPVVASNIGPFKEIVGTSQIIVDANNISEISDGIIKYIENPEFRYKMSNKGIRISSKFNRENNVKVLIKNLQ